MQTAFGIPVIISVNAIEMYCVSLSPIVFSKHRSLRIWKKLVKRQRKTYKDGWRPCAYMLGDKMVVHPEIYKKLKGISKWN